MNFDSLAIIGNGFDLAHGFNTLYRSFVDCTNSPALDLFRKYCERENEIETWYNFEENVNIITNKLFHLNLANTTNYEEICKEIEQFTEAFRNIHSLMIEYLRNETTNKAVNKILNIEKVLTDQTFAINFNYTNIAQAYTNNIYHIHGSLEEDNILLGYDYRDEACLAQYKDMCWSKTLCRESLEFRRYLKNKMGLSVEDAKYKEILNDFNVYIERQNSSRGLDELLREEISHFDLINEILSSSEDIFDFIGVDYEKIIRIIILGHGIEADKKLLQNILEKCINLKEIVIYRYSKESETEYQKKAEFFLPFCENIIENTYN